MTASLWIDGPLPNLNDLIEAAKGAGGTGRRYAEIKRIWTERVWVEAKRKKLPGFAGPVDFVFTWVAKDRRQDKDNMAAGGRKMVLDGLVLAGTIPSDGWNHVIGWRDIFDVNPDRPGVGVVIANYDGTVIQ